MSDSKNAFSKKNLKNISYFMLTILMLAFLWLVIKEFNLTTFFNDIETKSFDLRARMFKEKLVSNPDIVIVSIDDDSIENMQDEYGRWPWTRQAYTDIIEYLQKDGVDTIAFDLMFIGNQRGFEDKDKQLIDTIAKYDNVYVSMNFDYRESPFTPDLPDKLKASVQNKSQVDYSEVEFTNCRLILQDIIDSTENIGLINFVRDTDGISRRAPSFFKYKGDYYPYLALKIAYDHMKKHNIINTDQYLINEKNELLLGNKKVQLDDKGFMILNWYGKNDFKSIPAWKILKSSKEKAFIDPGAFKNKIVYVGVTATSLYDIKSTPLQKVYPGVKIQTTALNNILDENPIKRVRPRTDLLLTLFLVFLTGIITIRTDSTFVNTFAILTLGITYFIIASLTLNYFDYWVGTTYQLIAMVLTFTIMYIIKYINKAKDFEYTYKLATTDGLTELYNHRYFQEQMANNIETCKRYESNFSLVLIDIDFFKKFNDTYGHQAGDAVLRQVAQLLKRSVRATDIVCRYGGEEMAIILTNTGLDEAYTTAQKICNIVAEKPFSLGGGVEKNVTISLGVSTYPLHGEKPAELIEFSDQGLYAAKEDGRNQVGKIKGYEPKETKVEVKAEKE